MLTLTLILVACWLFAIGLFVLAGLIFDDGTGGKAARAFLTFLAVWSIVSGAALVWVNIEVNRSCCTR